MYFLYLILLTLLLALPLAAYVHQKPAMMHASQWQADHAQQQQIEQYFVSEKLDGIRLLFNGRHFISRSGNVILTPKWFIAPLRQHLRNGIKLDGELWLGRGRFNELNRLIAKQDYNHPLWQQVHYKVFDALLPNQPFLQRKQKLQQILNPLSVDWIKMVQFHQFSQYENFEDFYQQLINNGAEGVMLIKQQARYQSGRVLSLKKHKPSFDAEATVIGYTPGQGKYRNMVGALIVRDQQQRQFNIGSGLSEQLRQQPPAIGDVITFEYSGLTHNGLPRFPRFLREYRAH